MDPDLPPPPGTVAIRYEAADGEVHIWTCGPTTGWNARKLRTDVGRPRAVDVVRWFDDPDDAGWRVVDDDWPFDMSTTTEAAKEILRRYGFEDSDDIYRRAYEADPPDWVEPDRETIELFPL